MHCALAAAAASTGWPRAALPRIDPPRGAAAGPFSRLVLSGGFVRRRFGCAVRVNSCGVDGLPQGEWGGAKLNYGSFPFTVRNGAMDDVQVITV